jgi:hypothetical protein
VKTTEIEQLEPGLNCCPLQLSVSEKTLTSFTAFSVDITIMEMDRVAVPLLVTVTVRGWLAVFTACDPNVKLVGDSSTRGPLATLKLKQLE